MHVTYTANKKIYVCCECLVDMLHIWYIKWQEQLEQLEQLERLRTEDTPAASWLPIPLSHIGSQVKRRQSQSYKFKKFAKISNFLNFETGITRDTPSEVAW